MKFFKFLSLCLTVCILSSFFTFAVTKQFLSNQAKTPAEAETKTEDLYESRLVLSHIYEKCGHTISDSTVGNVSYSSADELKARYPGYAITAGGGEEIVLSATFNSHCPHHYFVILKGNKISISRLYDGQTASVIKTDPNSLSQQEKKLLEAGITLNSDEALASFIEDFTS